MATTTLNSTTRKTLASQLDRLDVILDGLADNLNDAVAAAAAGAVREVVTVAVHEAVHSALVEILSHPEVQKRLVSQPPSIQASIPLVFRLAGKVRSCWGWLTGTAKSVCSKLSESVSAYLGKVKKTAEPLVKKAQARVCQAREQVVRHAHSGWMLATTLAALARRFRKQLAVALGVGILVGVICYLCGREIASVGCGLAGFVGSLASDSLSRLRRLLPHRLTCTS